MNTGHTINEIKSILGKISVEKLSMFGSSILIPLDNPECIMRPPTVYFDAKNVLGPLPILYP